MKKNLLSLLLAVAMISTATVIDEDALDLLLARAGESLMHLQNETDN